LAVFFLLLAFQPNRVVNGAGHGALNKHMAQHVLLLPILLLLLYQLVLHVLLLPAKDLTLWSEVTLRWLLLMGVWYYALLLTTDGSSVKNRIKVSLIASSALVGVLAIGQYLGLLEFLFPVFEGYDQEVYSVFGNQDLLGGYMALGLVLLLEKVFQSHRSTNRSNKFMILLVLSLILWALVLSHSRSAWLAASIGIVWCVFQEREQLTERSLGKWAAGASLLAALILVYHIASIYSRIWSTFSAGDIGGRLRLWFWEGAMRMIADHPFFGVGLGNFGYWSPRYLADALHDSWFPVVHHHNNIHTLHAHSDLLEFIAENGIVGLAILVWFIYLLHRRRLLYKPVTIAFFAFALINPVLRSAPHVLFLFLYWAATDTPSDTAHVVYTAKLPDKFRLYSKYTGALIALLLLIAHGVVVLVPSYLLAQAEDTHLVWKAFPEADQPYRQELAIQAYDSATHWPVVPAQTYENFGILQLELGNYNQARALFETAAQRLDTGGLYWHLGQTAQLLGNLEEARAYYDQCLYRWPGFEPAITARQAIFPSTE